MKFTRKRTLKTLNENTSYHGTIKNIQAIKGKKRSYYDVTISLDDCIVSIWVNDNIDPDHPLFPLFDSLIDDEDEAINFDEHEIIGKEIDFTVNNKPVSKNCIEHSFFNEVFFDPKKGNGVKQNYEKAVEWYTKAAEQGNSEAQDTLGDCYYLGNGVEQNYEKAVEWYTEAAESNNIYAMYDLAVCYYYGKGTSQDYQEAVRLFKSAADEGSVESLNFLGDCYYEGNGVTQSYSTALSLYNEAMSNNSPQAYYNLGSCYRWGNGVPKDKAKAKELFKKGIELGSTNCSEAYEDMLKNDDKIKMAKKIGGEVLNGLGIQGGILGGLGMLGKACINSLIDDDDDDED